MTRSQQIGYLAAWQPVGACSTVIVRLIQARGIKGAARQATADAAMLHMARYQSLRG